MKRTVANIYEDTRELLDRIKQEYDFKSDDHVIKFLCSNFVESPFAKMLKDFHAFKKNKEQ